MSGGIRISVFNYDASYQEPNNAYIILFTYFATNLDMNDLSAAFSMVTLFFFNTLRFLLSKEPRRLNMWLYNQAARDFSRSG